MCLIQCGFKHCHVMSNISFRFLSKKTWPTHGHDLKGSSAKPKAWLRPAVSSPVKKVQSNSSLLWVVMQGDLTVLSIGLWLKWMQDDFMWNQTNSCLLSHPMWLLMSFDMSTCFSFLVQIFIGLGRYMDGGDIFDVSSLTNTDIICWLLVLILEVDEPYLEGREHDLRTAIKMLSFLLSVDPERSGAGKPLSENPDQVDDTLPSLIGTKSPSTVSKRCNSLLAYFRWHSTAYPGHFCPLLEDQVWTYIKSLHSSKAAATEATSFVQALRFAWHVLFLYGAKECFLSRRIIGNAELRLANKAETRHCTGSGKIASDMWGWFNWTPEDPGTPVWQWYMRWSMKLAGLEQCRQWVALCRLRLVTTNRPDQLWWSQSSSLEKACGNLVGWNCGSRSASKPSCQHQDRSVDLFSHPHGRLRGQTPRPAAVRWPNFYAPSWTLMMSRSCHMPPSARRDDRRLLGRTLTVSTAGIWL